MNLFETLCEIFLVKEGECLVWNGAVDKHTGYGRMFWRDSQEHAHRVFWSVSHEIPLEEVPEGSVIHHSCYRRACVNPAHLSLVSHKRNTEDRAGLNRNNTSGVRGVYWNKRRQLWVTKFMHNGKSYGAGGFKDLSEAAYAVEQKRNELYSTNVSS